ncbi:hypothetical protein BJ912DRAFT_1126264 [Pholiota molesta]|nr:hypothetical protein BJ912DRAFT_1126264 [Pholiota molesta]
MTSAGLLLSEIEKRGSLIITVNRDGAFQFSSSPSPVSAFQCRGASFKWDLGSPYTTYPFAIHDPRCRFKPNYTLIMISPHDTSAILVRSLQCTGTSHSESEACLSCQNIGDLVSRVDRYARKPPINLDRTSLSHRQLEQKLRVVERSLKREQLLGLNSIKSLRRHEIHKKTFQAFFDLAGTQDVPGLHRILKNSKERGWSATKLLDKTQKALDGEYHPKNFSNLELDLATAIYELGGGAALHALHKSTSIRQYHVWGLACYP